VVTASECIIQKHKHTVFDGCVGLGRSWVFKKKKKKKKKQQKTIMMLRTAIVELEMLGELSV
jgi:hypothetical protein